MIGTQTVEPVVDSGPQGKAPAFQTKGGTVTGTTTRLSIYLNADATARRIADFYNGGHPGNPGTVLSPGTLSSSNAGRWNQGTVPAASVRQGWQQVLDPDPNSRGVIKVRDLFGSGRGAPETNAQYGLITVSSTC